MAFSIHRASLMPALAAAAKAVPKRSTIPILSNVRVSAERGHLQIVATDLDIQITTQAELAKDGVAEFSVPAATFHDFVSRLPENAEIGISVSDNQASMSFGRTRIKLPTLPVGDFPDLQSGEFLSLFYLPAADLTKLIGTVMFAVSTEETRYYLNGAFLHALEVAGEMKLRTVATDGHRLARCELPLPEGAETLPGIIVPRTTCNELLRLLGTLKGEAAKAPVQVEASSRKIRFTLPNGEQMLSKLIDGTFPDYQRVIPVGNANCFTVDGPTLRAAIDRVSIINSERGRAAKFRFNGEEKEVGLECSNPDSGSTTDAVSMSAAEGVSVEMGFNARYAIDLMDACGTGEVRFALSDAGGPAVVTGSDPSKQFVLMPMRV